MDYSDSELTLVAAPINSTGLLGAIDRGATALHYQNRTPHPLYQSGPIHFWMRQDQSFAGQREHVRLLVADQMTLSPYQPETPLIVEIAKIPHKVPGPLGRLYLRFLSSFRFLVVRLRDDRTAHGNLPYLSRSERRHVL